MKKPKPKKPKPGDRYWVAHVGLDPDPVEVKIVKGRADKGPKYVLGKFVGEESKGGPTQFFIGDLTDRLGALDKIQKYYSDLARNADILRGLAQRELDAHNTRHGQEIYELRTKAGYYK